MRKQLVIIFAILVVFVLPGCQNDSTSEVNEQKQILTYEQFRKLFNDMATNISIPNSKQVEKTDGLNLVAIDKNFSFGKRLFLTLNGDQSDEETQERIIFKDENGIITLIDLIYLKSFVGNDLILWPTHETKTFKSESIMKQFDEAIVSYNNVLVKISQISDDKPLQLQNMYETIESMTSFLQSYKP